MEAAGSGKGVRVTQKHVLRISKCIKGFRRKRMPSSFGEFVVWEGCTEEEALTLVCS